MCAQVRQKLSVFKNAPQGAFFHANNQACSFGSRSVIICSMRRILAQPMVFVDIETTGGTYKNSRILEIGVVRVENNQIVDEFRSLLDPAGGVPRFITELTGITAQDVQGQPKFEDIAVRLKEILEGATFVAHNVRFDYSFIKHEFMRVGIVYNPHLLCTVRLSRALFPQFSSHKLGSIIERHGLQADARHRAYEDALVLWQFIQLILREFDLDTVDRAIAYQIKRQSLPPHLNESDIQNLPDTPGVYLFMGEGPIPLYIGKSINIRERVLSHFNDDLRRPSEMQISQNIRSISTIKTTGELGALLLESKLIKELQPLHNRRLRRIAELASVQVYSNPDGYACTRVLDAGMDESAVALYRTKRIAKQSLLDLAAKYRLCKKLLGAEKAKAECFDYQLGRCNGACIGEELAEIYNKRLWLAFDTSKPQRWPYSEAIMITERHPFVPGIKAYVVKDWILLAEVTEDDGGATEVKIINQEFDLDAYRILSSYLKSPQASRTVREVRAEDILSHAL